MRVVLRKVSGEGVGDEVLVAAPSFLIGRSPGCNLRPACFQVSRMHCELIVRDGYVAVKDLGSKNGTFVNNNRVIAERQLLSGDELGLGMCLFEVLVDEQEGPLAGPQQSVVTSLPDAMGGVSNVPSEEPGCSSG